MSPQKRPHHDARAGSHPSAQGRAAGHDCRGHGGDFDGTATPPGRSDEVRMEIARSCPRCRDQRDLVAQARQSGGYASAPVTGLTGGRSMRSRRA